MLFILHLLGYSAQNKKFMGHGEKILIIGRHADMLEKVSTMLNRQGYSATGKQWNEEALTAFKAEKFDAVVIGGGVDNESRDFFHTEFPRLNPLVKIIDAHPQTILADLHSAFEK
jgi:DNA-binding NtrC family response regulator